MTYEAPNQITNAIYDEGKVLNTQAQKMNQHLAKLETNTSSIARSLDNIAKGLNPLTNLVTANDAKTTLLANQLDAITTAVRALGHGDLNAALTL